eukprot:CAMPEP_0179281086 /NCGR_PEP_ID=MMETSP0797-20121207/36965_1 /TAXON_ID=47934 /ORGANISM="Dinophysis acuminata, Strain DAEP01" /LENGTH=286 /DNA_ID=CAMNT_0020989769 /DNA_START=93 /DNA_END=950 /DNA_ORIENTATION=-
MLHKAPRVRVDEAVIVRRAPARERRCQDGQALEAEAGVAVAAHHLVALRLLRPLLLEVLLRDGGAAAGALLRARVLHPPAEAVSGVLFAAGAALGVLRHRLARPLPPGAQPGPSPGVLLARQPVVVRLRRAADAAVFAAQRAVQPVAAAALVHGGEAGAVGRRAVPEASCSTEAPREEPVEVLGGEQLPKVPLRNRRPALGAAHLRGAGLDPGLGVPAEAVGAVPAVAARQADGLAGGDVLDADGAGLAPLRGDLKAAAGALGVAAVGAERGAQQLPRAIRQHVRE